MNILLVRHAPVLADRHTPISASKIPEWVEAYDRSPIDRSLPDPELIEALENAKLLIASSLPRSAASLELLGLHPDRRDSLFDEVEVPNLPIPLLRLSPEKWLFLLRILMISRLCCREDFRSLKERARQAAHRLEELARLHGHVALLGHGGFNWLLSEEFSRRGWEMAASSGGHGNWGYRLFEKGDDR
ncbi:hypothetical protein [Nitratifractor sp.]